MKLHSLTLIFFSSFLYAGQSQAECPIGWNRVNDFCFYDGTSSLSRSEAEAYCKTRAGSLVRFVDNPGEEYTFVCKTPYEDTTDDCDVDNGFEKQGTNCFKLVDLPKSFHDANKYCKDNWNSYLTSVMNEEEQGYIANLGSQLLSDLWIGLSDTINPGNFEWINGYDQLTFKKWDVNEPNITNVGSMCVKTTEADNGLWKTTRCSEEKKFVCKKGLKETCPSGWTYGNGKCYNFYVNENLFLTWPEARDFCAVQNAQLLKVESPEDQAFITKFFSDWLDLGILQIWLGISDISHDGMFTWSDQTYILSYNEWDIDPQTTQHGGVDDCAWMYTGRDDNNWEVGNCFLLQAYVCEINEGISLAPFPKPVVPYSCFDGWRLFNEHCYYFAGTELSWQNAEDFCQQAEQHYSELVSVHDEEEQSFLSGHIIGQSWSGMTDSRLEGEYVWSDGTPSEFFNWKINQPNNDGDCVRIIGIDDDNAWGQWNDQSCSNLDYPICKTAALNIQPQIPTTPSTGDNTCGDGYYRNTGNHKCYKIVPNVRRTWSDARMHCQQEGGDLLSINTPEEQAFIEYHIVTETVGALWTGAEDSYNGPDFVPEVVQGAFDGGWRWIDGSPFNYVNWASGEPNAEGDDEDCVEVLTANGYWNDKSCNHEQGYICEKVDPDYTEEPAADCTSTDCCFRHLGVERGGEIEDDQLSASSQLDSASGADRGRLNTQDQYFDLNGGLGPGRGAWIAADNDAQPWLKVDFRDWREIRGIVTQGRNGLSQPFNQNNWVKEYSVQYMANPATGLFEDYKELDGAVALFTANYDQDDQITNIFTRPIVTTAIKILPTQCRKKCAMRVEILGCMPTCVSSLGLSKNPVSVDFPLLTNEQFSASSQQIGYEAYNARLDYSEGDINQAIHYVLDDATMTWNSAREYCMNQKSDLCSYQEICSTGTPIITGVLTGDQWAPIRDGYNDWVELGDDFGSSGRVCYRHNEHYAPPDWGITTGRCPPWDTTKTCDLKGNVFCCPVNLKSWKPMQNSKSEWIQVDFGEYKKIGGVLVQGDVNSNDWITSYYISFSDDGQSFTTYRTPSGDNELFPGCVDRTTPVEGFLREPISTRFLRIKPQSWNNNIALRMDVVGCDVGVRSDCTDQANSFTEETFTIDCPGGCDKITDKLWGTGIYTDDSYICAAAIHDGRIINDHGGSVTVKKIAGKDSYTGSVQHGITSQDRGASSGAVMFQGDHLGCPTGWEGWRDWCYYLTRKSSNVNYDEGRQRCQSYGGDLVSIHSQPEQDFAASLVYYGYGSIQNVWIGMTDLEHVNYYKWADGSDVTYTMWDFNEPNGGDRERCVHMYKWSGFWNDQSCSDVMNYMCKMDKIPVNQNQVAVDGCPNGWVGWEASCYLFDISPSVWTNAEDFCSDQGGHLASIESYYEQMFITGQASQTSHPDDQENFYIGLGAFVNPDGSLTFKWSSGEPVTFTAWGKEEPMIYHQCTFPFLYEGVDYYQCISFGKPYDLLGAPWCSADSVYNGHPVSCEGKDNGQVGCIVLDKDTGYWSQANPVGCGSPEYRICEIPRAGYTTPSVPTPPSPNGNCPNGWYAYAESNFCYQINEFTDVTQRLTWDQAKLHCETQGANLVSIHSSQEEEVIVSGMSGLVDYPLWIGLKRQEDGQMGWSDKTPVSYTNWGSDEPNNHNGRENCAEGYFATNNTKWNDMNCDAARNWICKVERGKELVTPGTVPTGTLSPQICDSDVDWVAYTSASTNVQKCYYFSATPMKSWHSANTYCQGLGGTLVSITTLDEQVFITGRSTKTGAGYMWIGLVQDTMYGPFIWVDGSPLTFENWQGGGQPDNNNGQELCVHIDAATGLWLDENCGLTDGYICQKYPGARPGTPTPTPVVPGGCPNGWIPYGSKCFLEIGFTDNSLRDTWENAEKYCQSRDASLASVPNEYYNAFLTSQLFATGSNIWIGLNSLGTDLTFKWSDNEEVLYTNWGPNEPNNFEGLEECVEMSWTADQAGKWNDQRCSDARPYFCSRKKDLNFDPDYQGENFICPENQGFVQWDTGCYKTFTDESDRATWDDARAKCQSEGQSLGIPMDLASVWNVYENDFLMALFWPQTDTNNAFDSMWIGLYNEYNTSTGENLFYWSDQSPVVYSKWGTNEPQIPGSSRGCVVMNRYGTWGMSKTDSYQVVCNQDRLPFVCKYETLIIPEQDPGVGICEAGWAALGDYCYRVVPGHDSLDLRSWGDADRECQSKMGFLASIHSDIENKAFISWTDQKNVWIGLSRNGWGGWDWVDSTPVDYTNWAVNEPNDAGEVYESCVELYSNGGWNDISCLDEKGYICKKHKTYSTCAFPSDQRQDCGYSGINIYECTSRGCCWDETGEGPHTCYYSQADASCMSSGGTCKDYRYQVCELGYETLLCSGGNENRCCYKCASDDVTCTQQVAEWEQGDENCEADGYGFCQYVTNYCASGVYESSRCGGPSERQCCVLNPVTLPPDYSTTTKNNPPTASPTQKPITKTTQQQTDGPTIEDLNSGGGLGGGAIAGIVISVLVLLTAVIVAFYFFKKGDVKKPYLLSSSSSSKGTSAVAGFDNPISYTKETESLDEYDAV